MRKSDWRLGCHREVKGDEEEWGEAQKEKNNAETFWSVRLPSIHETLQTRLNFA